MFRVVTVAFVAIRRVDANVQEECGKGLLCGALTGSTTSTFAGSVAMSMMCADFLDEHLEADGGSQEFKKGMELGSSHSGSSPEAGCSSCVTQKYETKLQANNGQETSDLYDRDVYDNFAAACGCSTQRTDDTSEWRDPEFWKGVAANTICEGGADIAASAASHWAAKRAFELGSRGVAKVGIHAAEHFGESALARFFKGLMHLNQLHENEVNMGSALAKKPMLNQDQIELLDRLNGTAKALVIAHFGKEARIERERVANVEREKTSQKKAETVKMVIIGVVTAASALGCWFWKTLKNDNIWDNPELYAPVDGMGLPLPNKGVPSHAQSVFPLNGPQPPSAYAGRQPRVFP